MQTREKKIIFAERNKTMYIKKFEVRWSDTDANRHLRNSSYIDYMSHTRLSYMLENGLDQQEMATYNLGAVAFYEHIFYFREIFPGKLVRVSLEFKGMSEDGMYFQFLHNFYDENGKNLARCEMMGGWINLKTRKLTALPEEWLKKFESLDKSKDFQYLTQKDTRRFNQKPEDLQNHGF